jgi:arylsulfatase A-like enzyme
MKIQIKYCILLAFLSVIFSNCKQSSTAEYPNIVIIFTDQQNANMMSVAGNPLVNTPNMDKIAETGVYFTQTYCSSPVCGPSRSSLITGFMPSSTGVVWNGDALKDEIMNNNIGFLLRQHGYNTIWAGKWHLPESYPQQIDSKIGKTPGFDMLPFWDKNEKIWAFGNDTDVPLSDAVENFLDTCKKNKPFFLAVSYHNPHDICFYPRKVGWFTENDSLLEIKNWGNKHRIADVIGTNPDSFNTLPPLPKNHEIGTNEPTFVNEKRLYPNEYGAETHMSYGFSEKEWRGYLNAYSRLTEMVDVEVGKIIYALKRNGLHRNTIIIFTSDHGDGAAAHKWSAKNSLYKESAMVPLIISWPGKINANAKNSTSLVSLTDVVPTLLDLIGINTDINFHGKSLKPVLYNQKKKIHDYVVVELADDKFSPDRKGRLVRSENFTYCLYSNGEEQLYDVANDPMEMTNLAGVADYAEIIQKHKQMLNEWMKKINDDFVVEEKK